MRHPRGLHVPTSLVLCALALLAPALARPAATPPARATVVWPRHDAARAQIDAARRRLAEQRATWPRFLTAPQRDQRIAARGLLTRPAAKAGGPKARLDRAAAAGVDTAEVLLVRVGFAANRAPNLSSMDASGDFRTALDTTVVVDPPPHDAHYFDAELLGLHSYYDIVSHGQLFTRGVVFPPQDEPSLKLSDPADYGPGEGGVWTLELLEHYFRDAVALVDSASGTRLDLAKFDSIVLMHPGSDLQNDINRDSPNDLPSFFVTLADSVPVEGGTHAIFNGLVLPEQLTQDGLVGGILGGLCHEFGHQLGLPDWYDTKFGLPAIGEWDLMDSGNAAFFAFQVAGSDEVQVAYGLLPTGLSAMSRYLLGWEDPYRLRAPADAVTLRPSLTSQGSGPRVARLDVSADEYFLVENRRDLLYEQVGDVSACPYLNRDADTGVILWASKDDDAKPPRERRNSGEYDYFISAPSAPESQLGVCGDVGFGLLVWHVDERVLAQGYGYNEVNTDERRRSLRLLEASGDFEIGDWRLPTSGFLGDGWNDPFRQDYKTVLREDTRPDNLNNDWAHTGWEITDVRFAPPESHTLSVRVVDGVAGWPRELRAATDTLPPLDPAGAVYAPLGGAGTALVVADSAGVWAFRPSGATRIHRGAVRPGSLAFHPNLVAGDSVGTLAALDSTGVWLWDARLAGDSLQARAGFPVALPGGAGRRLVLLDDGAGVLAETAAGDWVRVDPAGLPGTPFAAEVGVREAAPVVGPNYGGGPGVAFVGPREVTFQPLPPGPAAQSKFAHGLDAPDTQLLAAGGQLVAGAPDAQVVVLRRDGALRVVDPQHGITSGFVDLPRDDYSGLALGDVNGDGELDIVAASATRIVVETSRGAMLLNSPIRLQNVFAVQDAAHITCGPLVADVAGDSLPELLVGTDLGLVYALDASGAVVPGYPRKMLPDAYPATVLATDVDGVGGDLEVLAVSSVSAGATSPAGGSRRAGWTGPDGDAARHRFATAGAALQTAARLSGAERAFLAYPNPARAGLVQLRITAAQAGSYALSIYNLEGQVVFESHGSVAPGTKEIPWSCDGMASGVYLCRFVSQAAGVPSPLVEPITLLR